MLNQTINVKIKYENIIKRLIDSDQSRDFTLKIIEQAQQQQYSGGSQRQFEQTQNVSSILANAAHNLTQQ